MEGSTLIQVSIDDDFSCCGFWSAGDFPKSVCTSVNECVCHGIPDSRELQEGDIVNIDVTVYLNVTPPAPFYNTTRVSIGARSVQHLA